MRRAKHRILILFLIFSMVLNYGFFEGIGETLAPLKSMRTFDLTTQSALGISTGEGEFSRDFTNDTLSKDDSHITIKVECDKDVVILGESLVLSAQVLGMSGNFDYRWEKELEESIATGSTDVSKGIPMIQYTPENSGLFSFIFVVNDTSNQEIERKATVFVQVVEPTLRFVFTGDKPESIQEAFVTTVGYRMDTGEEGNFQFVGLSFCEYGGRNGIKSGSYTVSMSAPPNYSVKIQGANQRLHLIKEENQWVCQATIEINIQKEKTRNFYKIVC